MFYLPKEKWSPRFDSTFFTIDFGPQIKCDIPPKKIDFSSLGGNSDHPALYYEVNILSGRQSRTLLRRYSQFYHVYKELQTNPTPENAKDPIKQTLSIPPRTCLFQRVDEDFLIERKNGLESFLKDLLGRPGYIDHPSVQAFLEIEPN